MFTCLLIGFNMGCSILFANRFGARDFAGLRRTVFTTGVILAGVTVLLTGVGLMCLDTVITLIQTPAELRGDCREYLFWILLGLAFTALYNLCATLLQALGKTQVTLLALTVAMVSNIGLDLLFVAGFQLRLPSVRRWPPFWRRGCPPWSVWSTYTKPSPSSA